MLALNEVISLEAFLEDVINITYLERKENSLDPRPLNSSKCVPFKALAIVDQTGHVFMYKQTT